MKKNSQILVTGASSMIGRQVCRLLEEKGYQFVFPVFHNQYDLTSEVIVSELFGTVDPKYVIHLAGHNGGIEFNRKYPHVIFEKTVRMAINILGQCSQRKNTIKKVISALPSCAYPGSASDSTMEEELWNGPSHPSVDCHGHAKRILHAYSAQLNKIGIDTTCCMINNSYGPHDKFDPDRAKVVGGMIKRFVDAKRNNDKKVVCWGSGRPQREFIYCQDAAEGLIQSMERNVGPVINISSGEEVTIKQLAETIADEVGYEGNIEWDLTKTDGQMRKRLDTGKMNYFLDVPITSLQEGIRNTVNWYEKELTNE